MRVKFSGGKRTVIDGPFIESVKIIARLARIVSDIELAEELAQDALVIALERQPVRVVQTEFALPRPVELSSPGTRVLRSP